VRSRDARPPLAHAARHPPSPWHRPCSEWGREFQADWWGGGPWVTGGVWLPGSFVVGVPLQELREEGVERLSEQKEVA